jgi:hypothetical protein
MLSSKMFAGLLAGGLGMLLDVVLVMAFLGSPTVALMLEIALLLGVGMLAGILAIRWLDPADDGRQKSVGALAGLVAACIVGSGDILLRVITNALHKPNLTDQVYSAIVTSVPSTGASAKLLLILINLLFYLLYIIVTAGIAGATAEVFGGRKSQQAQLQHALEKSHAATYEAWVREEVEGPLDPALLMYQRRDYSPFADDPEPPLPVWQRRRLGLEGRLNEDEEPGMVKQSGSLYPAGFPDNPQRPKQPRPRAQFAPLRKGLPPPPAVQKPTGRRGDRRG